MSCHRLRLEDPGDLVLDYTLADGSVFPNGFLRDPSAP